MSKSQPGGQHQHACHTFLFFFPALVQGALVDLQAAVERQLDGLRVLVAELEGGDTSSTRTRRLVIVCLHALRVGQQGAGGGVRRAVHVHEAAGALQARAQNRVLAGGDLGVDVRAGLQAVDLGSEETKLTKIS